ncbi:MAG: TIM-barrel domain-containing protein [Acidimicrobiales bacterium]
MNHGTNGQPRNDSPRSSKTSRVLILGACAVVVAVLVVVVLVEQGNSPTHPHPTTSSLASKAARPGVDLTTDVNMSNGIARKGAVVLSGDARFEVLAPTVIRLEYSPSANFENSPTVNVLNRRLPVPRYTSRDIAGWLTIQTDSMTLKYKIDSGPFSPLNTSLTFENGSEPEVVRPTWDWECTYGQSCQAGDAVLSGAQIEQQQTGYVSQAGYVGHLSRGESATWNVIGSVPGSAGVTIRYSNIANIFGPPGAHTLAMLVNGRFAHTVDFPETSNAAPWSEVTTEASLASGTNTVEFLCSPGDSCDLSLDTIATAAAGSPAPQPLQTNPLGGWLRGFDTFTYSPPLNQPCAAGTAGVDCVNPIEPLHQDGLLDRAGWRLLDDSQSAVWTKQGWVAPRTSNGDVQDGYLFAYGQDYSGALRTFYQLTGDAPLLPRSTFGVWYSDYTPYSSAELENSVYKGFLAADVPLNTLSLDTDWKAPNSWDGWEWNTKLFPNVTKFLEWAKSKGISVTLNVHSSIADNDPKLPQAEHIAQNSLAQSPSSDCTDGPCKVWDWSSRPQAQSNFVLQQSFLNQGVAFWWLDWCCDDSVVTMPGLDPDAWIGHLYAQEMINQGERGFVLTRIGSSNGSPEQEYPAGPWSDHTSAIAFTGDAWGTWTQLATEVALTPAEATVGEPYVSDDVGSYLGPPPTQGSPDPPDLFDRWVQFGTFQPILRLHSDDGNRLPWQYPEPVSGITESFLRLREELIPYTYTLASEASRTGMPIAQPLYLDYPSLEAAYDHPGEYLFGSNMLVAPVTTPGTVAQTTVWLPPGRWIDYFTGATVTGPSTVSLSVPLDQMPVFVRAGGIVPLESNASSGASTNLTLKVYSGSAGTFDLYGDSGSGLGYERGQYTDTEISDSPTGDGGACRVTIGAAKGRYPREPKDRVFTVEMINFTRPSDVTLDGTKLSGEPQTSKRQGWYYNASTHTIVVDTGEVSTSRAVDLVAEGSTTTNAAEASAG